MKTFGRNEPLVLKTYGKHSRKVERWLSPDNRKVAFASTSSSDLSIGEQVGQKTLRKRKKTLSTASSRPVRAAKKKALAGLRETDSDEENVFHPTPDHSLGANRKRRGTLSVKALVRPKRVAAESTSESEEETAAQSRLASSGSGVLGQGLKTGNSVVLPSYLSRFVSDRRRGAPKMPRVSRQSQTGKKPVVSIGDGSLNSSEDFVKGVPRPQRLAQRRRMRPVHKQELCSGNTSSELVSPIPNLSRARSILKAVSVNSTADRPLGSSYKKPLLSSTPSVSSRPSYRHQEPSISEISCCVDNMEEALKTSMEASRSLVSPGQRELKVLLERSVETERNIRKRTPEGEKVGLLRSAGENCVGLPQHSKELFSRIDCESEMKNGVRSVNSPSLDNLSVQFVSAESHLVLLAASLRERSTAVVVLEKTDLSEYLSGGRDAREEDTFSSCVDSESALKCGASQDKLGPGAEPPPVAGSSDKGQGDHAGQIRENGEDHGAGFRSGESEGSASVVRILPSDPPGSLSESGSDGHFREAERGSFVVADASRPTVHSSSRVSVAELSRDLFLEVSEVEPHDRSVETLPAEASCEKVSLSPQEVAHPRAAGSREAYLKSRCISVQPIVVLEVLDLSRCTQDCANLPALAIDSTEEPQREATNSESDERRSPVGSGSQEQPESSSPEGPRRANLVQDGRRPDDGLRRRLSSVFVSDAAKSPSFAPSPRGKKHPDRVKNQGGPPKDKPGTGRKACVSGLSVNRWAKNNPKRQRTKKSHAQSQLSRTGDCSLFDFHLGPEAKKQPDIGSSLLQGTSCAFPGTPLRMEPLNISSFLADFTPESLTTHTWSRLKAALSVHKKKKAFFTPKKLNLSHPEVQGDGSLDESVQLLGCPHSTTPLSHRLRASLLRSATATPMSPSLILEDITDAEKLYHECQQEGPITFEECIPPHRMKLCKKVGEGTFGEVFTTTNDSNETVALKVVPIEGRQKVNGEDQKTFGEILHEVIISKELSGLDAKEVNKTNGFIGLNNLHCVRGSYPMLLLSAWDKFDKQRRSENDRPDFFEEDQLFLILEFEFGGSDLEAMNSKLSSLAVAKSILHQVTAALAVAEQALCFEHRDLHWGNILVKTTKEKTGTYVLNGTSHSVDTKGVHVNIIDYSLSRLEIDGLTVSCDISADEELFMGQGDYQFDIYRKMRQENNNSWSEFNPHTNVLWLHYLADKLLHMRYRSRAQSKPMRDLQRSIQEFHQEVLAYKSAACVLERCSLFQEA